MHWSLAFLMQMRFDQQVTAIDRSYVADPASILEVSNR
jgi:hypothetical protein